MAHLQTPSYPPRSSFSLKSKCLSCCLEAGAAVMPAHLQVEKKGLREFLVTVTKLSDLWPALHQEWLTEKMWERGRERPGMPISSIVQPAHLTFLLIVCLNKGGWQRWCCSIDRMVMGVLKGPRGWWMGQLECSCKMTVSGERQQRLVHKHTRIFSHTSGTHEYTFTPVPIICTVLIKLERIDRKLARAFLSSLSCSGHFQHVN